jgi:TonB family protein
VSAQPRSAPDIAVLQGLPFSGLPMRVRLTIDSTGRVVDVALLRSLDDPIVNEAVQRMFLATAFVPARRAGIDVASVEDIELSLDDVH